MAFDLFSSTMKVQISQPEASARDLRATKRAQNRLDVDVVSSKRRKVSAAPLQLTDINNDCLRRIFEYLEVVDLVNVAEADDNFIPVAADVILRRIRRPNGISIRADVFAAFLTHFGHFAFYMTIEFGNMQNLELQECLETYCRKSLRGLIAKHMNENHFESIQKPFVQLKNLQIVESTLGRKMSQMSLWFPNLVSLTLSDVNLTQPKFMEVNLPQLEHLAIDDKTGSLYPPISKMMRFNPQLIRISLNCHYDVHLLQSISKHLVQLEELELWVPNDRFGSFVNNKSLFTTVKKFTLNDVQPWRSIHCLPFEFSGLRELVIFGLNQSRTEISKLICECQHLNKLAFYPSIRYGRLIPGADFELIFQQLSKLPELNEVKLCAYNIEKAGLTQLLRNGQNVQHVEILLPNMTEWFWWLEDDWKEIENEWIVERAFIQNWNFFVRPLPNCVRLRWNRK